MRALISIAAVFVMVCVGLVALLALSAPPSTMDLDSDLSRVRQQIADAEKAGGAFGGGLLRALIDARLEVYRTNEAFLQMKRDAILRRVVLQYIVEGQSHTADNERIRSIEADIAATAAEAEASRQEADRYTGGLVQTLALVQEATHRLSLAQLNLALMAERHGFLLRSVRDAASPEPVGKTVVTQDGDAL